MHGLYIIAGPNGAGKSTAGADLLPQSIRESYIPFDGDKLKMMKQKEFRSKTVSYKEAGRLADHYVHEEFDKQYKRALLAKDHFVYEGHFSDEASWNLIRRFRDAGYFIDMIFLGLVSLQLSSDRVFNRAIRGGHNVPPLDIEKNYFGNLIMINKYIDLIDQLTLLDASGNKPLYIGQWYNGKMHFNVTAESIPTWVSSYFKHLI